MANEFKIKKGLIITGSGGIILDIQGSQGQLFSVTDNLLGDVFTVSDISGMPLFNVNSDSNTTVYGPLTAAMFKVPNGTSNQSLMADGSLLTLIEPIIEVTISEVQTLITNSELISDNTYRINGIDGNFCDGFFKALAPNRLNLNGSGIFRNPNYELINLWTNQFYNGVTVSAGEPFFNEVFTLGSNSFIWKSLGLYISNQDILPDGTYSSVDSSVTVSGADVWSYAIDDRVIFGNKHWKNLTGNLGSKVDEITLSSDWVEIFDDLNFVVDEIEYDIENNWVTKRKDSRGNEISLTKSQSDNGLADSFNYVKTFNWGKEFSDNNKITSWSGSICNVDNVLVYDNVVNSFQVYDNIITGLFVFKNTGNSVSVFDNTGIIVVSNNSVNDLQVSRNNISGFIFELTNNMVVNSQTSTTVENGLQVYNNIGNKLSVSDNIGNGLQISNNTINDFTTSNNTVNNLKVISNTLISFRIFFADLSDKTIQFCDIKQISIGFNVDISNSTYLFGNYGKTIFKNSVNGQIITFYNENNVLVVANITD